MFESKIAIVGGIPGVGKTTVINIALESAKKEGVEINTIVYGSEMMQIAKKDYNVQSRDDLRKLPPAEQKEIQRLAAISIAKKSAGKVTIVDTHYSIKTGSGTYLQGIPSWVSDGLNPRLLILIETIPENISLRRNTDPSRERDEEDIDRVKVHQELNRTIAATICQKSGALLGIIQNKQGIAEEAGKILFEYLKTL
ncbi:MAG TPA: adenylate kinase [candidate division Zixibacteria bacterium]|nr:adenylate kinase [candidate division Zixibacteria bacterium]